jgi:Lrp/AsnC family leucine-responsive transcriptional regulator
MTAKFAIDAFDEAILAIVQQDNQISHAAIGARVNLSESAVRRRLKALRAEGVIVADVAVVDPGRLGLSFIVQVVFEREDPQTVRAFGADMAAEACVSQCYSVSGEVDFVLVAHAASPAAFEAWGQRVLMAHPAVKRFSTALVWSRPVFRFSATPAS